MFVLRWNRWEILSWNNHFIVNAFGGKNSLFQMTTWLNNCVCFGIWPKSLCLWFKKQVQSLNKIKSTRELMELWEQVKNVFLWPKGILSYFLDKNHMVYVPVCTIHCHLTFPGLWNPSWKIIWHKKTFCYLIYSYT